jgi:hypothetical protein
MDGDLLVGLESQHLIQMRDGVVVGELDSGYGKGDGNDSFCQGITSDETYVYATRTRNNGATITNAIQKFERSTGSLLGNVVEETIANIIPGPGTGYTRFFQDLILDGAGNLVLGLMYFADNLTPETTVYMVERYSPAGVLLDQFIPVQLEGSNLDDLINTTSAPAMQSVEFIPENGKVYYVGHRLAGGSQATWLKVMELDLSTGAYTTVFFNTFTGVGNETSTARRRPNGEIWAALYGLSGTVPEAVRLSAAGAVLATYDHPFGTSFPFTSLIDLDAGDAHFWLSNTDAATADGEQLARIPMDGGPATLYTLTPSDGADGSVFAIHVVGVADFCDPETITSVGPTLWVEADAVTGLNSGDGMASWPEAGAIAIDGADDLTAANFFPSFPVGPIWSTDGPCGMPVVQFDSATGPGIQTATAGRRQESLTGDEPANYTLSPADEFTIIAVGRVTEWDASGFDAFDLWAEFGNSLQIAREDENTDPVVRFIGSDSTGLEIALEVPYTTGEWVFASIRARGGYATGSAFFPVLDRPGTIELSVNGTKVEMPWAGIASGGPVWCDWNAAAGDAFAEMLALMMFPRYVTNAELSALRSDYFACRYPCVDLGEPDATSYPDGHFYIW